ncbi:uromodulin-like [Oculina patagonica]
MVQNICELNNQTKESRPEYFVSSRDRYYITSKDVDECILGTHNCLADVATCTNTYGSYKCSCDPGFKGDGKTSCETLAPECLNYQTLTEANRKVTSKSGKHICDRPIGPGWFRFQGDAGTKMSTTCPDKYYCDTHAPGWINGEHPTVEEGKVTRQVCFHWYSNCCHWSTNIEVRNCGAYYVYYLKDTPFCTLRYCIATPDKCHNYQSLTEANRKNTSKSGDVICDKPIGPGWFRFQGDAGLKMPTTCPPTHACDTHAPGWLNGGHPTVADGKVTRQVCFHWDDNCCNWSTNIEVRNCGSYYVYYFRDTPACSLRYCGSD